MGFIEIAYKSEKLIDALLLLVSREPSSYLATIRIDGGERLVTRVVWRNLAEGTPPGVIAPAGTVGLRAAVSISHSSYDDTRAGVDDRVVEATLWLRLSASMSRSAVAVAAVGLGIGNDMEVYPVLPRVTETKIPAGSAKALGLAYAGVVSRVGTNSDGSPQQFISIRFTTIQQEILDTPIRGSSNDGDWLIRISGDLFAAQLANAFTQLESDDVEMEDHPRAEWTGLLSMWLATGTAGIVAKDKCPSLLGAIDISVSLKGSLRISDFVIEEEQGSLDGEKGPTLLYTLRTTVDGDFSDWDVIRCWGGSGLLLGLFIAALTGAPLVHLLTGSLVAFGEIAQAMGQTTAADEAGRLRRELNDEDASGQPPRVTQSKNSLTVELTERIEGPPLSTLENAYVDETGFVISGRQFPLAGAFKHSAVWAPETLAVESVVPDLRIRCGGANEVSRSFEIEVKDIASLLDRDVPVPVRGFSWTSKVLPAGVWDIRYPDDGTPYRIVLRSRGLGEVPPAEVFLHTSAGLKRYEIPALGSSTGVPDAWGSDEFQSLIETFCSGFHIPAKVIDLSGEGDTAERWIEWLKEKLPPPGTDPVPGDDDIAPLRQWQLRIRGFDGQGTLAIYQRVGAELVEIHRVGPSGANAPIVFEWVTDVSDDLGVLYGSGSTDGSAIDVQVDQRWLLNPEFVPSGVARAIKRTGSSVRIESEQGGVMNLPVAREQLVAIVRGLAGGGVLDRNRPVASVADAPLSATLPDGSVVVPWRDGVVWAMPSNSVKRA